MKPTEQTNYQIERVVRKIAEKFPSDKEASVMTDIHLRVAQETGELTAFDDNEQEITRCVVEQWIGNCDENFYSDVASQLRQSIGKLKETVEGMAILKPFSFVLEDDERENISELYLVDDETVIIDPDLMEGLDEDLNNFFDNLFKD